MWDTVYRDRKRKTTWTSRLGTGTSNTGINGDSLSQPLQHQIHSPAHHPPPGQAELGCRKVAGMHRKQVIP